MKVVGFWRDQQVRLGFLLENEILEPGLAGSLLASEEERFFRDVISFIRGADLAFEAATRLLKQRPANALHRLDSVRLAAPMWPSTILCAGSNYREHNEEKAGSPTSGKEPEFFLKTSDSVIGPQEPIRFDESLTRKLDCETELGIVIGAAGRHIPKDQALKHIFGYTIVNDVTARDRQVRRSGSLTWYDLGRGKAFDTSAPLGPCIVTVNEIADPQVLDIRTRINGELRQSSNTRNMIWTCADLIHFFSINFTLKPGMVIITGHARRHGMVG
jgi:2-keto-4-pentenoate hydratase/2-oxohepta-3-ene-1,7-dioic acid hydratase in catechol pathway